ncbi:non-specific serine,threonine protein kinase [Sarracenia purpurea var. burkii]
MDSARNWFQRLRHKEDKLKPGPTKKKETENSMKSTTDDTPSNATKQKVAAAKQYIESHYKAQMKCLQDRKERH